MSDRLSHHFGVRVGPGGESTETVEVREDATVERVDVRIYTGPRQDLEVVPFVERVEGPQRRSRSRLVELHGKDYVDGDGDTYTFHASKSVEEGDLIGVEVVNQEEEWGYDTAVTMVLEREGGAGRSLVSMVSGVLA
jgi:hypothetical protein